MVLDAGVDVAQSENMHDDHGISQQLEFLLGTGYKNPMAPILINAVGLPLAGGDVSARMPGPTNGWRRRAVTRPTKSGSGLPPRPRWPETPPSRTGGTGRRRNG
ncbi:hypothetical protein GCM10023063_37500 [Arthrobacter methylotrophus]